MTNDKEELAVLIAKKKDQIDNHERILKENGTSRWYSQSKRYWETLKEELKTMEENYVKD
jgi:hypothetical protein